MDIIHDAHQKKEKMTVRQIFFEWSMITFGAFLTMCGAFFFKFPNHFTFGGVTGLCVIIGAKTSFSPSQANMVINAVLLICGFIFLGRDFGIKTVYATALIAIGMSVLDSVYPMRQTFTNQTLLELVYAVVLPGIGGAFLFFYDASGGGTDIIAMIIKKHSTVKIGNALIISDLFITLGSLLVFDVKTFLFSLIGMMSKSLVIDRMIRSLNMSKVINVVCKNPDPVCNYITRGLNRGATIMDAHGAYSHDPRYVVMSVMKKREAFRLRRYLRESKIDAFITVTETSEIFGKGFKES
jgi:uncharacterized membrane-anchored protein YitT (DUF2179 family)